MALPTSYGVGHLMKSRKNLEKCSTATRLKLEKDLLANVCKKVPTARISNAKCNLKYKSNAYVILHGKKVSNLELIAKVALEKYTFKFKKKTKFIMIMPMH